VKLSGSEDQDEGSWLHKSRRLNRVLRSDPDKSELEEKSDSNDDK
jgi:hypothetical protein